MSTQSITIPTAQLYLGSYEEACKKTYAYLQSVFCPTHGCATCIFCVQIYEKRHASCLWLTTKKQYMLDDLLPLQEKLQFRLGEYEKFFFIIESAELLSLLSANALLKSLEEPPSGYHFILLAKESASLLPTIVSRCIVFHLKDDISHVQFKILYDHFTHKSIAPSLFLRELDRIKITEDQTEQLCKQIIQFWQQKYAEAFSSTVEKQANIHIIEKKLNHFYEALTFLPKSGNTKLFWKKMLLQFTFF